MNKIKDGGPAFPITFDMVLVGQPVAETQGMTVRDKFADSALRGLASQPDTFFGTIENPYNPWPWMAEQAYKAADAMIAERERQP